MFYKKNRDGYSTPLDGIQKKTLVHGEKTLMAKFKLQKACVVPQHSPPMNKPGILFPDRYDF